MKYTRLRNLTIGALVPVGMLMGSIVVSRPVAALTCAVLPAAVCGQSGSGDGVLGLLKWGLNILTVGVGIAAVGALIFAGVLYSSAGGDSGQVSKAKTMITNTVIGIVLYALVFLALKWLLPGDVIG